ncbi:MAG: PKD domain-containing protein [Spirochaetota bacterium]
MHGSVIAGTINIRGTNYENWSSITANMLYTNDGFYGATAATSPWDFALNSGLFTNGVLKLALVTSNGVGMTFTNTWSNYVSNAGPTISFTNPAAAMTWITNATYSVQGWASNAVGQITGVWFSTNAMTLFNLASGNTNWTTNVDVSAFPITNVFYAVASNEYGYVTTNFQTNLVDVTLPFAQLTNITSGGYVSGIFTFRGTNYDAQSGIFGTRVIITNTAGAVANIDGMQNYPELTNNWNSAGVADGRYFAYISTTNGAGMLSNGASTMFVVNNLAPDIRQTNITQLGTNTGTLTFIGYATNAFSGIDPAAVYMMTNLGTYAFITNGTNFATNFNTTLVTEGTNLFIFAAVSSNFRTNTWYQTNIIDNSAPTSVVTNYVHGSVIAGTINIRGTNYENWSSITANVLYTNDGFYGATAATAPWDFSFNSGLFTNGVLKLALVTSNGVNLTYTNTWSNYVSNAGPTISFTNPAPMVWITNATYAVQGWASNAVGQVTGVWFSTNVTTLYNLASGNTNWTTNVDVSAFPITNVFYAVASNEYGYVTTNFQTNLVDVTLPYAQLTNITSGGYVSGVFAFRGTNFDAQSGIFGTRIVITNTAGAVANIDGMQNYPEFTNNWNSVAVADGRYFAYVSTTNGAGMLSNGASTMFVVNNLLPQIIQTNIGQLGTNAGILSFAGYATNAYSGIDPAAVYMMTNGGTYSLITNGTNFATNFASTLVSEGTNLFIFAAVSSNFRTNTWYQTNIIDNSAPISVVTNYVHGSVIAGGINIRGTNYENWSAVTANVLYTNDGFYGATVATAPWDFSLNSGLFTNGVLKLALVTSNGVNLTFTNTWSNYVSNAGPTLAITNPAVAMTWITNATYAVQGWASNAVGQVAGVWFSTNATTLFNLASGNTNWTTNVDVSAFPITNVFYAVASNEYGYVTTNLQTNLVDVTLPYATLTNITSGGYVSGVFTFRGTNHDAQSSISATRIFITNAAGITANITGLQNNGEFTNLWDTTAFVDGRYFAYVSTTNGAGLLSNGASTMFVVNNIAPDIRQTNVTQLGTNTGTLTFIGYATNAFSGIDPATVYMMTNGGAYSFITNGTNFATNFATTLVSEGTNIFIFAAVSSNYRTNTWYQTNIIDNSAPISVVTNYVHGSVIASTVVLRGTNYENWSSITANVLYTNNGFYAWTNASAPWDFMLNSSLFTNGVLKLTLVTSNGVNLTSTNTWSNYVSNGSTPFVYITNTVPLVWITNSPYTLQGLATNVSGEMTGVYFSTNAASGYGFVGGTTTNWTTNIIVAGFPITNVFYAVASNEYGYVTTNFQTNFVDVTLPFVQLTNFTSGSYVSGIFTFRGTNYDAQSGIFGTRIVITNTAGAVANIDGMQNYPEFTNNWNSGAVADGRYFAYVSTTNGAGMLSNGASTMFVVNNIGPDVRQTNITQLGTNTGTLTFIGYATNAFSGIDPAAVYMMTNGGAYSLITNGTNFATNFASTLVSEGTNIFIFAGVSSNARTNTWYQTNIIDNSAPISVVTNYVHGSVIAGTINIRGTNYENWSSITANVLYTNDAFFGWTAATAPWSFALNSALFTNGVLKLTVVTSNGVGLTYTNTWSNYASNGALTAAFTSDKTNVYTYTPITFTDLSTSALSITNWLWDLGDGYTTNYTSFIPSFAHTYTQMTTCWVVLTVWDTLGSNTVSNQYVISNQLPTASFVRTAASASPFVTNYFTNTSTDADGWITNFRWEFGDGVISNGASFSNMTHRYTNGGTFSVVFTVWDNNGGVASNTSSVTIGEYAAYFVIYGSNTMIAGDTNEITMMACAPDDSRAAFYNGYKSMTFGGAMNAPDGTTPKAEGISFGSTVFVYFTNGYATNLDFTMALYRAGSWTITASDGVASTAPAGTNVFTVTVTPGDMHKNTSVISASPRPGSVNTNVQITIEGYDAFRNKTTVAAVPAVTVTVSGSNSAAPLVVYAGGGNYTADYTPTAAGEDIIEAYLGVDKILSDADGTSDGVYHLPISVFETARISDLARKARGVTHGGNISVFSSRNPAARGEIIDIYYEVVTNSVVSIGIYDMSGKLVSSVIENRKADVPGVSIVYNVTAPATRGLYLVAYTSVVNGVTKRIYWKLLVK